MIILRLKFLSIQLLLLLVFLSVLSRNTSFAFQSVHSPIYNLRRQQSCLSTTAAKDDATVPVESALVKPKKEQVSVLLCPAQFCVPADYEELFVNLRKARTETQQDLPEIGTCRVAPLPRTEWIKVARQLPTRNFLDAKLSAKTTLRWYFDAIEKALADIFAEDGHDTRLCIIGHSIGGWVARGFLGGLSGSSTAVFRLAQQQCTSLVTIGTPHISPEDTLVDQTRGLLREIKQTASCSPAAFEKMGIDVTCVGSSGVGGNFLSVNIEELVAASSYLPLTGKFNGKGDGIVPLDLAFMDSPARRVVVEACSITGAPVRHSHIVPTPWSLLDGYAPSWKLPENFVSYVSAGVLPQWSKYIR